VSKISLDRKVERFHQLHLGEGVLCLLNAWDAGSARIFEAEGSPALATTSAGVAYAHGKADGELSREQMIEALAEVTFACDVPVSADIEGGFGVTAEQVGETVGAVIEAGAVGINLEDAGEGEAAALRGVDQQSERIGAARAAAEDAGVRLFINGRTDALMLERENEERLEVAIERLRAYVAAGADGVFVPRLVDGDQIRLVAEAVSAPLNVLVAPGTPSVDELHRLGVRRLSTGSAPARAALELTSRIAGDLLESGTYESMVEATIPYAEANRLFAKQRLGGGGAP
jgi:2-methylisocitrate lyase-like PEP mutase family enzyme